MEPARNALIQALESLGDIPNSTRNFLLSLAHEALKKNDDDTSAEILKFQEHLRWESRQKPENWGQNLLNALVPYLKGIQASLYILAEDGGFDFAAGYAVSDFACIKKKIIPGNTLMGEVAILQEAYFRIYPIIFTCTLVPTFQCILKS